jgi:hypothetical protein
MKQKTSRKLMLNKQKVSNLSKGEMREVQGGTGFCGVIVATTGCISDFTRPVYSLGCATDFTRPISIVSR